MWPASEDLQMTTTREWQVLMRDGATRVYKFWLFHATNLEDRKVELLMKLVNLWRNSTLNSQWWRRLMWMDKKLTLSTTISEKIVNFSIRKQESPILSPGTSPNSLWIPKEKWSNTLLLRSSSWKLKNSSNLRLKSENLLPS